MTGVYWPKGDPQAGQKKTVLASLNWHRPKDPRTPLGAAYLYSWLSRSAELSSRMQVGLLDETVLTSAVQVADEVIAADPEVLGIGVYVWNNPAVRELLSGLRARGFGGTIVLGGPEISYGSSELLQEFPEADYFVKGEGEAAFEEILSAVLEGRPAAGAGIFTPQSDSFDGQAHLPPGSVTVQPQSLPELIPLIVKDGFARVEFQRGCIYGCSFCAFPFKDRVFRELDLGSLSADLSRLREAGVRELAILDPVFFVHKPRAMSILRTLAEQLGNTRFEIQTRLEHLDEVLISQLSQMNVLLECGVQSLDPMVEAAIRRRGDHHTIKSSLNLLRDRGVPFDAHLIFGLPYQTLSSLLRDMDFLLAFRPRRLRLFPLLDHRGTELSAQTRTLYRGRLIFSTDFPRQIEETAWMPEVAIAALKQLHLQLEERAEPLKTMAAARTALEELIPRQEEGVPLAAA